MSTLKPCGTHVLIKILEPEEAKSPIIIPDEVLKKEREGRDVGEIMDIGPVAYLGYKGCVDLKGPEDWGVKIGDIVEFRRYDGKIPRTEGFENYRWLNDEDIIGVVK